MKNFRLDFLNKKGDKSDEVKRQIISLGGGYDTFVFGLMDNRDKYVDFNYYELDFPQVIQKKVSDK